MYKKEDIKDRECKFVVHVRKNENRPDLTYIKEKLHLKDGRTVPNVRVLKDFKRPVYITKEIFRDHQDKKEFERLDRVELIKETESDIVNVIANRLGKIGYTRNNPRDIKDSPYLYGYDIGVGEIIKSLYDKALKSTPTKHTLATGDIENDVDNRVISVISFCFEDELICVINKSLIKGIYDPIPKLKEMFIKHIPESEIKEKVKNNITYKIVDNEIELLKESFKRVHEKQPDLLAFWNIGYDMTEIEEACRRNNADIKDIICDPKLPKEFREYKFRKQESVKITASGKRQNKDYYALWHSFNITASFSLVDQQNAYYLARPGKQVEPTYSLDYIANKETKGKYGKLKTFSGIPDNLIETEWHKYMVKNKPLEYIIYNNWDVMLQHEVERETEDITSTLPTLLGISNINKFASGPKKIVDDMYLYALSNKVNGSTHIIGTSPVRIETNDILGRDNWIVTLEAHRIVYNGLKLIKRRPSIRTNMRAHVYDSDAVSSYPSNTIAANISKSTTRKEVIKIGDIPKDTFKRCMINSMFGPINSIEYSNIMFKTPKLTQIDEIATEILNKE